MGKYDKVLAGLTKAPGEDPDYQDKVNAVKREILKTSRVEVDGVLMPVSVGSLGNKWAELRALKDALKEKIEEINLELEAYGQMLDETMEVTGLKSIQLETGQKVFAQPEPYAVVEDKETYRQWCIENGFASQMHLNWNTTNAMVKETLVSGYDAPPGVKAYVKTKLVLRKG
jgi:hypothetical protein